jgi:hypothetical protein
MQLPPAKLQHCPMVAAMASNGQVRMMMNDDNDEVKFCELSAAFCGDSRPLEAGVFSLMRTLES